jgi:hypothetical protein
MVTDTFQRRSPWRAPLLMAGGVLAALLYFNLSTSFEYVDGVPAIIETVGWPLDRHVLYFDLNSLGLWVLDAKTQATVAPGINAAFALLLTALAAFCGWLLRRANGRLLRMHLTTALLVMLFLAWIVRLNTEQHAMERFGLFFGWPHVAFLQEIQNGEGGTMPQFEIHWFNLARNTFVAAYGCLIVWTVGESWIAWRAGRLLKNVKQKGSENAPSSKGSLE